MASSGHVDDGPPGETTLIRLLSLEARHTNQRARSGAEVSNVRWLDELADLDLAKHIVERVRHFAWVVWMVVTSRQLGVPPPTLDGGLRRPPAPAPTGRGGVPDELFGVPRARVAPLGKRLYDH